jgi:hypothetical protein
MLLIWLILDYMTITISQVDIIIGSLLFLMNGGEVSILHESPDILYPGIHNKQWPGSGSKFTHTYPDHPASHRAS